MPVPITEEERNSPFYKYYELDIADVPKEVEERIMGEFDPADALLPHELNRLFDDGYLPGEFGWYRLPDGGLLTANLTPMPGVTPEMFDWWFAWHGLAPMHYKIWDKDDHHYCLTRNPEKARDESLSMKERYWYTTHDVRETMLSGRNGEEPRAIQLSFVPPVDVGFDPEKLAAFKGTIICTPGPAIMCHFVRPTADGSELRTRFWMGYRAVDRVIRRFPEFTPQPQGAKNLLMHNVKEFTHLAKILPDVYNEFKDRFDI